MKKYILFDHDGVLVDTEPFYYSATMRALAEIGIEMELAQYLDFMADGISCWQLARQAEVGEAVIEAKKALRNRYYQQYLVTEDIEIEGVEPVLAKLSRDFQMAIVTTAKKADFELIHASRNITCYMAFVLVSGDYARSKPYPDPYLTALERFGANKEETIVVEDSSRGLKSAIAAGIDCVVVHNEFTKTQDFSGATHHIQCLTDLPAVLLE